MPKKIIYAEDAIDAICKACSMEGDYHKCNGYPETSTWCDELVALRAVPSAQTEIIRCEDCMHNGSFDTDCPIDWNGKEYCSFAERIDDE